MFVGSGGFVVSDVCFAKGLQGGNEWKYINVDRTVVTMRRGLAILITGERQDLALLCWIRDTRDGAKRGAGAGGVRREW
jgi:hypothetical protein